MPLTLVLGPANSAKAGEVLGAYADAARRGALLIVPTAADAEHYGRELAGQGAVFGSVLTFSGLAAEIARRVGYRGRRLSPLQRERVIERSLARVRLELLADSGGSRGFVAAAGELIAELQRALVDPDRFAGALVSWAAGDRRRRRYGEEVASIYAGYVDELERLHADDLERHAWRALDALRQAPGGWGSDAVFFYGFDDLTALERDAVETLSRIVGADVTVSLTYEPGRIAFAARAESVEELRALAQRVRELPALDDHYAAGSRGALHHLERSLFEPGRTRVEPGDAVLLLESGGVRAEAELVAAEVLNALRAGIAPDELVIIVRAVAQGAPAIERALAQYGIASFSARRVPFGHTALGRGVLALARCAWLEHATAADLLAYARTPGLLNRPEKVDDAAFEIGRRALRTVGQARDALGLSLAEIDSLRASRAPAADLSRQARRLLGAAHRGDAPLLDPDEGLDARALAGLVRACDELAELGERPSGPELIELVERLEVSPPRVDRAGAVLISDPLGVRARRFRAVFVCGLQEGEFPRPGTPEPFLSDELRRELAVASGLQLTHTEVALARERYLFYACVSRATDRLILSYRSSDEEGNIELRSPFVDDVEQLLGDGWAARRRKRLLADVVWPAGEAPTDRERARSQAAESAPSGGGAEPAVRRLGEVAMASVRHRELVSAGALEHYADCPVRWLVERQLEPLAPEPDPEPLARGSYMHAALERLLRRLGGPVTAASLPEARRLLGEVMAELPQEIGARYPEAVRAGLRRAIEADLDRYLTHEAADACGWAPDALELRFGFTDEDGALPPVTLGEGEDAIALRGVIDRVDIDPAGSGRAIVRDYKSSSRDEHRSARWAEDRRLQVALYMVAVRRLLGLEPVAGLYQPLSGSDLRARGAYLQGAPVGRRLFTNDARGPEELEELLLDAQRRAVEIAARLRSGELTPYPRTCSRTGCAYPGICRSQ